MRAGGCDCASPGLGGRLSGTGAVSEGLNVPYLVVSGPRACACVWMCVWVCVCARVRRARAYVPGSGEAVGALGFDSPESPG